MIARILFLMIFSLNLWIPQVHSSEIIYSPLPVTNFENLVSMHQPLIDYIKKNTNLPIKLHYIDSYKKLIEEYVSEKIHITVLGPLPFYLLKNKYPNAQVIAIAKEKDGGQSYSCVLFTRFDGPDSIENIKGPLALPQKISTCALFAANILFSDSNIDVKKLKYSFFNNHNEVAEAVLGGSCEAGIMHSSISHEYTGLALKTIKETPKCWHGFAIIANPKILDKDKINQIKKLLLEIKLEDQRQLVFGKNGFYYLQDEDYLKPIRENNKFIPANLIE